jgi:C-terminal processing protease CtpA/Prc
MRTRRTRRDCLGVALLLVAAAWTPPSLAIAMPKIPATFLTGGQTILTTGQMKAELDYLVRILSNVHPAAYDGLSDRLVAATDAAYQQILEPMPAAKFYFLANTIVCSMQDAHTQLRPMKGLLNRRIDVPIVALSDGFYARADRDPFRRGDKIVALGDKDIETIVREMRPLIPAENDYWRRRGMAGGLQRHAWLDYLGAIENDAVVVGVERDGTPITLTAPLKLPIQCLPKPPSRPWVGYQIDADVSLGLFHLDQCHPNEHYKQTLREFFEAVREHRIRNVAVDLRRNGGGNSSVVDEFLRYLDIDRYRQYSGDVRYSNEVAGKTGYHLKSGYHRGKPGTVQNRKVDDTSLRFDGSLYVLTSPATFSSGNWFAVMIKDNSLGTIIGEPTGNAPSSYGDVPTFRLPNTGFAFTVSHKRFVRPNPDNDPADALYPDVPVYTTIDDIVNGTDPQLERLKEIIKECEP